jgi:hypothetical protein
MMDRPNIGPRLVVWHGDHVRSRAIGLGVLLAVIIAVGCTGCSFPSVLGADKSAVESLALRRLQPGQSGGVETAAPCPAGYQNIELSPENPVEEWLAPSLRACVRATSIPDVFSVFVINAGPAVWVVDRVPQIRPDEPQRGSIKQILFREATYNSYEGIALEPADTLSFYAPGEFVLSMHLNPGLQAAWEVVSRTTDAVEERMGSSINGSLSPEHRAIIQCAQSAYEIGAQLSSNPPDGSGNLLEQVLSGASATASCRSALEDLKTEAERTNHSLPLSSEDFEVIKIGKPAVATEGESVLEEAVDVLGTASKAALKIIEK